VTDGARFAKLVALEERQMVVSDLVQIPPREPLPARIALPEPPGLRIDERPSAPRPRTMLVGNPRPGLAG